MGLCFLLRSFTSGFAVCVQNNFAPTGFVKIPTDMAGYYRGCLFLPKLNNELPECRNGTYKQRFSSLNYLALIKFEADRVLYPTDTAWFGFYAPNDFRKVLPAEEEIQELVVPFLLPDFSSSRIPPYY
ncbi:hypothetical protein R1sor_019381 [Riccia sorocarpa]|uniref:Uncharacterized protein n=1 Tax=Riccia sorocarpa TaxID=122646 RepID=A0ABD3IIJ5_9MARC